MKTNTTSPASTFNLTIIIQIFLVSVLLTGSLNAYGQVTSDTVSAKPAEQKVKHDQRPFHERISLGGATSFWIQPSRTYVELSALLAYHFPKVLTVGPGYRYIYNHSRTYGKDLNSYGPNIFARAQLTKRIYFWSEWEYLYTEHIVQVAGNEIATEKDHVESLFMGLGYIRQFGLKGRGGLSFQVLYNAFYNQQDYSPYYSPVIYRVGYFF